MEPPDWEEPAAPYCLRNVLFGPSLPADISFPAATIDLWVFAWIEGVGDYEFWVDVLFHPENDADEAEELATYGPFLVSLGESEVVAVQRGWHIHGVPLPRPGWYESELSPRARNSPRNRSYWRVEMPEKPQPKPKTKRRPAKPVNDGFVVFEVDGFAQMTPEQRSWPVISLLNSKKKPVDPPKE